MKKKILCIITFISIFFLLPCSIVFADSDKSSKSNGNGSSNSSCYGPNHFDNYTYNDIKFAKLKDKNILSLIQGYLGNSTVRAENRGSISLTKLCSYIGNIAPKEEAITTCNNTGFCNYSNGVCQAKSCTSQTSFDCSTLCYCTSNPKDGDNNYDPTKANSGDSCVKKRKCNEYGKCVTRDDYGNLCTENVDYTCASNSNIKCNEYDYNGGAAKITDCQNYCAYLYDLITIDPEQYKTVLGPTYKNNCVDESNKVICTGTYSYYKQITVGGVKRDKDYYCGSTSSTGGSGTCSDKINYVQESCSLPCEPSEEYSCKASNCENVTTAQLSGSMSTGVNYDGSGLSEYTPLRYYGTCDGNATEVFCIDPSIPFDSNGYVCQSTLNEDSNMDDDYIKIYQKFIQSSNFNYNNFINTKHFSNDEYLAILMANRFHTYYVNDGKNTTSALAKAYNGTADKLIKGNGDPYFWLKESAKTFANGSNGGSTGYKNAVQLFKSIETGSEEVWELPIEIKKISASGNIVKVKMTGLDKIRNLPYYDEAFLYVTSCSNCKLRGISSEEEQLHSGKNELIFEIEIINASKESEIGVTYYHRLDRKNITVITKNQCNGFQRLLTIAVEPRKFTKKFKISEADKCTISSGIYYYNGKSINKSEFLTKCCSNLADSSNLRSSFCSMGDNKETYICSNDARTIEWANKGCLSSCMPTNTTDKCEENKNGNKEIIISDLTSKDGTISVGNTTKTNNEYCYTCAYDGDITGNRKAYLKDDTNPYCAVYCVNEYKFTVPTHLGVNGDLKYGRYLSIGVHAWGKQTCFTGKINSDLFNSTKADEVNSYYNSLNAANAAISDYNKWKNASPTDAQISSTSVTCSSNSCPDGYDLYGSDGKCYDTENVVHIGEGKKPIGDELGVKYYAQADPIKCENSSITYSYTVNGQTFTSAGCGDGCNTRSSSKKEVKDKVDEVIKNKRDVMHSAVNHLNDIINKYNDCSDKQVKQQFTFNPKMEFTYEDQPYSSILAGKGYLVGKQDPQSKGQSISYYQDVDGCGFWSSSAYSSDKSCENTTSYKKCSCNGDECNCNESTTVYCNNYVLYSEEKENDLTPNLSWCTKVGNGSAFIKDGTTCGNNANDIGNVYPLSRNCGKDKSKYNYGLKITDLGHVQDVLSTVSDTSINSNLKYDCDYQVNNKSCEGCESLYYYRSVSLNDLFTKVKEFHDMSNGNKTIINKVNGQDKKGGNRIIYDYTWSSSKGQDTKKAIEELGEGAYTKDHLQYSYELTPAGMKVIREYNDKVETIEAGGYGDFNLKCNGYNCISDFLNDIENKKYQGVISLKRYTDFTPYNGKPWK